MYYWLFVCFLSCISILFFSYSLLILCCICCYCCRNKFHSLTRLWTVNTTLQLLPEGEMWPAASSQLFKSIFTFLAARFREVPDTRWSDWTLQRRPRCVFSRCALTCPAGCRSLRRSPTGSGWPLCDLQQLPRAAPTCRRSRQRSHPPQTGSTCRPPEKKRRAEIFKLPDQCFSFSFRHVSALTFPQRSRFCDANTQHTKSHPDVCVVLIHRRHFVSLCVTLRLCFSELRLFVQALWAENLLSSQKSSDVVSVVLCVPAQAKMFTVFVFYASCHHPHPARSHVPRWNKNQPDSKAQRILSEQPELFCLKQTVWTQRVLKSEDTEPDRCYQLILAVRERSVSVCLLTDVFTLWHVVILKWDVTSSAPGRLLWKLPAGRSWSGTPAEERRLFKHLSCEINWSGIRTETQNQPQIQPSTVCRPESVWTESWCQNCAAGTLKSAPANKRLHFITQTLWISDRMLVHFTIYSFFKISWKV